MRQVRPWRRIAATIAGICALALTATACTAGPGPSESVPIPDATLSEETTKQLRGAVGHAMAASGASGAVVGVWVPWAGSWVQGLGTVAPDSEEPVTTDMTFRAADITRSMTCDVMYALDEEGTISRTDTITTYVPSVADLEGVTLEQLCDSVSGLGMSAPKVSGKFLDTPERIWNPRGLASYGISDNPGEPGASFRDSDAGYLLLGIALENATNRSASDLIDEYVADRHGLSSTRLPGARAMPPSTAGPVLTGLYTPAAAREEGCTSAVDRTVLSASVGFTNSGVVTTIDDLGRYARALATGEGNGRWEGALPADPEGPAWYQYAGGTYLADSLVGQQGTIPGYITSVYADRDTGLTVAVVLNNSAGHPDIARDVVFEMMSIASKVPAAEGNSRPDIGLPWTADTYRQAAADLAVCPVE